MQASSVTFPPHEAMLAPRPSDFTVHFDSGIYTAPLRGVRN